MASPHDEEVLLTREFVVLRVVKPDNDYGIDPYYLLYLLSHHTTQRQLTQKIFIDTTLPNIADRWRELLLPVQTQPEERVHVTAKIRGAVDAKWRALATVHELREQYGDITT